MSTPIENKSAKYRPQFSYMELEALVAISLESFSRNINAGNKEIEYRMPSGEIKTVPMAAVNKVVKKLVSFKYKVDIGLNAAAYMADPALVARKETKSLKESKSLNVRSTSPTTDHATEYVSISDSNNSQSKETYENYNSPSAVTSETPVPSPENSTDAELCYYRYENGETLEGEELEKAVVYKIEVLKEKDVADAEMAVYQNYVMRTL
jgi:hypothetical protein